MSAFFFKPTTLAVPCGACGFRGPSSIVMFSLPGEPEVARGVYLCAPCTKRVHDPTMARRLTDATDEQVCKQDGTHGPWVG
jgi:hypothetical protein